MADIRVTFICSTAWFPGLFLRFTYVQRAEPWPSYVGIQCIRNGFFLQSKCSRWMRSKHSLKKSNCLQYIHFKLASYVWTELNANRHLHKYEIQVIVIISWKKDALHSWRSWKQSDIRHRCLEKALSVLLLWPTHGLYWIRFNVFVPVLVWRLKCEKQKCPEYKAVNVWQAGLWVKDKNN